MIKEELLLENEMVRLEPLTIDHKQDLLKCAADGQLWRLWYTSVPDESSIDNYLRDALNQKSEKSSYPFVVIDKVSNKIVGCTRYCNIQRQHRRLEIGYTWYAKSAQRTGINTAVKLLLLTYAFESLQCIAVEFMTNYYNYASRKAILGIGAKQDGILRHHRINGDGTYRDTVVFSITDIEWSNVKKLLELRLTTHR